MLTISTIKIEHQKTNIITDSRNPRVSFALESDRQGSFLERYRIRVTNTDYTLTEPYKEA